MTLSQGHSGDATGQQQPIEWLTDALLLPLERLVSDHVGRNWRATESRNMVDYASHPCAILSDGAYAVFVKLTDAVNGREQFEIEGASLALLTEQSGVLTPPVIAIVSFDGGTLMIQEGIPAVERTPQRWRQIGQTLARIHRVKGNQFGLKTHAYFGPVYQDNTPMDDWVSFYAECRLWPLLKLAMNAPMPLKAIQQVETLISRLPDLCGPPVTPALLHGDAQQNNFISAEAGTYVIDPAVYYGHPEMDLAWVDYFQPVPQDVFDAYRDEMPLDPGFPERRELWRIPAYLAFIVVEGVRHVDTLTTAVERYL